MKNLEIRTIEHKGIKVTIKIDYNKGEASLVELLPYPNNEYQTAYQNKNWVFVNRGLEYMTGWLLVLEALKIAVLECKKELEFSLAQSSAFSNKDKESIVEDFIVASAIQGGKKRAAKKAGR